MKIISVFHNKGGVGKTTLLYHTACSLAERGKRVLMIDLDSQSNLTLYGLSDKDLETLWKDEDGIINDGFPLGSNTLNHDPGNSLLKAPRTIHFLLKPVESGVDDYIEIPDPFELKENLFLIPGRITLSQFENILADRWSMSADDNILSIRTISQIRTIASRYAKKYNIDYVMLDVSPSLGLLNRVILTTSDAFFMPATPDLFSVYGVRNIGQSLRKWNSSIEQIKKLTGSNLLSLFPERPVEFLGYTLYNAKRRKDRELGLARAHRTYAQDMPIEINEWIPNVNVSTANADKIGETIGLIKDPSGWGDIPQGCGAIWYTHNTYPATAQKYKCPIWEIPDKDLDTDDKSTVFQNEERYRETKEAYNMFVNDLLSRLSDRKPVV